MDDGTAPLQDTCNDGHGLGSTAAVHLKHLPQTSVLTRFVAAQATGLLGIYPCPDASVL